MDADCRRRTMNGPRRVGGWLAAVPRRRPQQCVSICNSKTDPSSSGGGCGGGDVGGASVAAVEATVRLCSTWRRRHRVESWRSRRRRSALPAAQRDDSARAALATSVRITPTPLSYCTAAVDAHRALMNSDCTMFDYCAAELVACKSSIDTHIYIHTAAAFFAQPSRSLYIIYCTRLKNFPVFSFSVGIPYIEYTDVWGVLLL